MRQFFIRVPESVIELEDNIFVISAPDDHEAYREVIEYLWNEHKVDVEREQLEMIDIDIENEETIH